MRTWHVGLSLMGTAAVFAGGLLAGGYLGQYRRMKHRVLRGGAEGPSLRGFERLAKRASWLGVLLLGPALALGVVAALREEPPRGTAVLVGMTAVCFGLLAVAGWIWWLRPLRGKLAAWLNLMAMVVVLTAFLLVHPLVMRGGG
jgi:ABC-type uncharacterized transport system permease subunit